MSELTIAKTNWQEQVHQLRLRLEKVWADLIEAEAMLAERLAAIHAFEFKLRAATEQIVRQLEKIETAIKAALHQQYGTIDTEDEAKSHTYWGDEGAAASGDYRYMGQMDNTPTPTLNQDETAELKKLYRQLARRFHPDMGTDIVNRAYRTQMMMAINAAYAAGDINKLRQLMLEPDTADLEGQTHTEQQLAEALLRELTRHQRRLAEIQEELANLDNHKSAHLMHKAAQAKARGRNFFEDVVEELQDKLADRRMELDLLQSNDWDAEQATLHDVEFDEGVLTLDEWMSSKERPFSGYSSRWDDDFLDDYD